MFGPVIDLALRNIWETSTFSEQNEWYKYKNLEDGYANAVCVIDNTLYVAYGFLGFQIFDISDISNPVLLSIYDMPNGALDLFVEKNIVVICIFYDEMLLGPFKCMLIMFV